jgi:predicted acyl esterase
MTYTSAAGQDNTLGAKLVGDQLTITDAGTTTEETALRALGTEATWLAYQSAPLARDLRIAGTPRLRLEIAASADHGQVTPVLVEIAPDGSARTISRGFLNLRYRDGLERAVPMPVGEPVRVTVTFSPQDHAVRAGNRIALVVAGSNSVWAVPDEPAGTRYEISHGGRSALLLPVGP